MCLQSCASVCASEKGKPVVRQGRKAQGPPSWEVAGLSNSSGEATKLRPLMGRRHAMPKEDHTSSDRSHQGLPQGGVELSLDELAKGLATGTLSRGKAIRWMGGAGTSH